MMIINENREISEIRGELQYLQARVRRHDEVARIEHLMYRYIHACDVLKQADQIAGMFTADAKWEGQGHFAEFGTTEGREEIRQMFIENPSMLPFTAHFLTNATVGVSQDLNSGWGTWKVLEAATLRDHRAQVWIIASYDNDFIQINGTWMIKHLRYRDTAVVPYEEGWLKTRYVSPLTFSKLGSL